MCRFAFAALCTILAISVSIPNAQAQESWAGKWIITKKPSVKILDLLEKNKVVGELEDRIYMPTTDENGWLCVASDSGIGWFEKADAILVEDAVKYFTQRINADKTDARSYACRGLALGFKDEYTNAIKDLTEALRLNPKHAEWFRHRGNNFWAIKDYDKSIADYSEALKLAKSSWCYCNRANAYVSKNAYDKAIADYTDAIRLNDKNFFAFIGRGFAYSSTNKYDEALADFDEAIRLHPTDCEALLGRGNVHFDRQAFAKAIAEYDEALRVYPKYTLAYLNRGMAYAEKKEYDKAIADYDEALRLHPKYTLAYLNRGMAYQHKKRFDKAIADYNETLRLDSKNVDACNNLAWLFATCPDQKVRAGKKAVEYATKACDLTNWKAARYFDTLAAAYAENGQFDEAVKYQVRALEDTAFTKEYGEPATKRLELYKNKKPFRDE